MDPERFLSNSAEAFQCAGCGYELRTIAAVEGVIQCPECGRATPSDELGTLVGGRSLRFSLLALCGPTLASGLLVIFFVALLPKLSTLTAICLVVFLATVVLVPPIGAARIVRGRFDRRVRRFWFFVALFGGWIMNGAMFFMTAMIIAAIEMGRGNSF